MMTRSRTYAKAFHSQKFGGVMAVESYEEGLEKEELEFQRVYSVMQNRGGFGKNNTEPPFYIRYDSREAKDAARRAFGPRCLNCAEDNHFARECPAEYTNRSGIINPAIGDGTPAESSALWRRWQQRLCQWHANRREGRGRRGN